MADGGRAEIGSSRSRLSSATAAFLCESGQFAGECLWFLPCGEMTAGLQLGPSNDGEEALGEFPWCSHQVLGKDRHTGRNGDLLITAGVVLDVRQERGPDGVGHPVKSD